MRPGRSEGASRHRQPAPTSMADRQQAVSACGVGSELPRAVSARRSAQDSWQ